MEIDRMSMISEQVKHLKELSNTARANVYAFEELNQILRQAADTIESLLEKLQAENGERSDRYYKIHKELVEQHNKAFELINKMPLEGNEVWHGYVGGVMQVLGFLIDYMERPAEDCGGGWIKCKDRLPTEKECGDYRGHFLVTVYANKHTTMYMEYEYTTVRGKEVGRWIWNDRVNIPWEVIAWQPLPEPYHEP